MLQKGQIVRDDLKTLMFNITQNLFHEGVGFHEGGRFCEGGGFMREGVAEVSFSAVH